MNKRGMLPEGHDAPVLVHLKGASGAGKTTLVENLLSECTLVKAVGVNAKRPVYLHCRHPQLKPFAVLGHYLGSSGGCDTLEDAELPWVLALGLLAAGVSVLAEGRMLSVEVLRVRRMVELGARYHGLLLNLTQEQCQAAVDERRARRGQPQDDRRSMEDWYPRMARTVERLREGGIHTELLSRAAAAQRVRELLS